jgi:hypothetical protein
MAEAHYSGATAIGYSLQSQIPGHEIYDNKGLEFQMNVTDKPRNILILQDNTPSNFHCSIPLFRSFLHCQAASICISLALFTL